MHKRLVPVLSFLRMTLIYSAVVGRTRRHSQNCSREFASHSDGGWRVFQMHVDPFDASNHKPLIFSTQWHLPKGFNFGRRNNWSAFIGGCGCRRRRLGSGDPRRLDVKDGR